MHTVCAKQLSEVAVRTQGADLPQTRLEAAEVLGVLGDHLPVYLCDEQYVGGQRCAWSARHRGAEAVAVGGLRAEG